MGVRENIFREASRRVGKKRPVVSCNVSRYLVDSLGLLERRPVECGRWGGCPNEPSAMVRLFNYMNVPSIDPISRCIVVGDQSPEVTKGELIEGQDEIQDGNPVQVLLETGSHDLNGFVDIDRHLCSEHVPDFVLVV